MSLEIVPVALACGHVLIGPAVFDFPGLDDDGNPTGDASPSTVEYPHGCGFVEYVVEPGDGPLRTIDLGPAPA